LAANINFLSSSAFTLDLEGQILSIFVLSVAAAEVAIGLAILVVYFKNTGNVNLSKATLLKDL
jgi:NADH-quinone oxidoreductase subunit K